MRSDGADNVVPLEDQSGLVAGHHHRDTLGDAAAYSGIAPFGRNAATIIAASTAASSRGRRHLRESQLTPVERIPHAR